MGYQCPKCGRFVGKLTALVDWDNNITQVNATCSKCGLVHPTDWVYETFFPEEGEER